MVNPWQATAWFPTAPQGFVSIQFNVRGWSKSFACDRASGACAAYFALRALRWGHNDLMLVGGSEAPVTRLGVSAHVSTGELSPSSDPDRAYLPYSKRGPGILLGVPVTVPKAAIGHLYGASTGTDIALALLAVRDRVIPATAHAESDPAERSVPLVAVTESRDLDTVVIVSRSREGANVVVVIGRDEAAESEARQHRCKTT